MSGAREILSEAVVFYRRRAGRLLGAAGLLLLPAAAASAGVSFVSERTAHLGSAARTAGVVASGLVNLGVWLLTQGAVTYVVAARLAHVRLTATDAWRRFLGQTASLLTASLASFVPLLLAALVFLVPIGLLEEGARRAFGAPPLFQGVTAWLRTAVTAALGPWLLPFLVPVAVIERRGGFSAYRRNRALAARSRIAVVLVPLAVLQMSLGRLLTLLIPVRWVAPLVDNLLAWLFLPLLVAAATYSYVETRSSEERYEPAQLAAELGRP